MVLPLPLDLHSTPILSKINTPVYRGPRRLRNGIVEMEFGNTYLVIISKENDSLYSQAIQV
jgi:hypothetical protein